MWIAERVWEQHLVSAIAEAGIEYTVLDDFHFQRAGCPEDDVFGYYLTEDDGRLLKVFPGSETLRYIIPFQEPHATYEFLRRLAERRPGSTVVFADDGEKFGSWPKTFRPCLYARLAEPFLRHAAGQSRLARDDDVRPGRRQDAPPGQGLPAGRLVSGDDGVGVAARVAVGVPTGVARLAAAAGCRRGQAVLPARRLLAQLQGEVSRMRRDVRPDADGLASGWRRSRRTRPATRITWRSPARSSIGASATVLTGMGRSAAFTCRT